MRALAILEWAHLLYAVTLVVVMRGWRVEAVSVGVVALVGAAVVNLLAYFHVSGVYF